MTCIGVKLPVKATGPVSDNACHVERGRELARGFFGNDPDPAFRRRALWIGATLARHFQGRPVRLLDIGCGRGYYFPLYQALGIRAQGVDIDRDALEVGLARMPSAEIIATDATALPHDDATIDAIVMSEILEHLKDPVQALQEANRVLKPGGLLLVTVPNAAYPFLWDPLNWSLERLFGRHIARGVFAGIWANHLRLYNEGNLRGEIVSAGFEVSAILRQTRFSVPFIHNLVYGLGKTLVEKEVMPDMRHEPYATPPRPLSAAAAAFMTVSNRLDRLNRDCEPDGTACVNLCVEALARRSASLNGLDGP